MKKVKMKDTILSHYQKVHELEMDGYTVRVFKPKTMQQLPSRKMLSWIKSRAKDAIHYMIMEQKADWRLGNPDYGMWDAQTVYHYDPRGKAFNIYIAAILVHPFSREAYETYQNFDVAYIDDVNQRLMADADQWAVHLTYYPRDIVNACMIFQHICSNVGIKAGRIDAQKAEEYGKRLRQLVIDMTGYDPADIVRH